MRPPDDRRPEEEPARASLLIRALGWMVVGPWRSEALGDLEELYRLRWAGDVGSLPAGLWLLARLARCAAGSHWHGWIKAAVWGGRDDDGRSTMMFDTIAQDLRYALRRSLLAPGFTGVLLVTLALGIGATLSVFSVVNGVLLKPLDYPDSDRIVYVQGQEGALYALSYPSYDYLKQRVEGLDGWSVWMGWEALLRDSEGTTHRVFAASVSGDFFGTLGASPAFGRLFAPGDFVPGHDPVIVLAHDTWRRFFGASPSVIGSTVTVKEVTYTVVGVVEDGFKDPMPLQIGGGQPALWRARPPVFDEAVDDRSWPAFWPLARVREEAGIEMVQAQVDQAFKERYPDYVGERLAVAVSLKEAQVRDVRPTLLLLMATAVVLLLIVCANVANLLLSRASTRRQEVAVRSSLGATRGRLLGQLLWESVFLAGLGTGLGLVMAWVGVGVFRDLAGSGLPRADAVGFDAGVALFAILMAGMTSLAFGLVPAFGLAGQGMGAALRQGPRNGLGGGFARRLQRALVSLETALSVVLLVGAGLFARTLVELLSVDPGFDYAPVLTAAVTLPEDRFPPGEPQTQVVKGLIRELEALPGVEGAGGVSDLPFSGVVNSAKVRRGDLPEDDERAVQTLVRTVAGDYFRVMSVPLGRGRVFDDRDAMGRPDVAVVNETFARRMFGQADPLGRSVLVRGIDREIVGVVPDMKQFSLREDGDPVLYSPYAQERQEWMRVGLNLVVAARSAPAGLAPSVRGAIRRVDPNLVVGRVAPLTGLIEADVAAPRFRALLVLLFASVAVVLSGVGTAGVIAYAVSRRLPEMGLRMALGARRGEVLRMVLRDGAKLTVVGLFMGLLAAFLSSRIVASFLFGVEPRDPLVFGVVTVFLGGVAILSTYLPARRAADVDPASALRVE